MNDETSTARGPRKAFVTVHVHLQASVHGHVRRRALGSFVVLAAGVRAVHGAARSGPAGRAPFPGQHGTGTPSLSRCPG
jgi:hypothetical protein